MARLFLSNGWQCTLPGLGKKTPFAALQPRPIADVVRRALQQQYRKEGMRVTVTRDMALLDGEWHGQCHLNRERLTYRVSRSTYL